METWDKLPLELMDELAERESYRRDVYRPIYSMHKWWARRPGSTFRCLGLACLSGDDTTRDDVLRLNASGTAYEGMYLRSHGDEHEGLTIMDPFAGGGTTLVELNRLGANTIGYELNPVAWFINKKATDEVDISKLESAAEDLLTEVRDDLRTYYETTDPATGRTGEVLYTFQRQVLPCLSCGEEVHLHRGYRFKRNKSNSPAVYFCPNESCTERIVREENEGGNATCQSCGTTFDPTDGNSAYGKYTCSNGHKNDIKEALSRLDRKPKFEPYAIEYLVDGEKKFKMVEDEDRERIRKAADRLDEEWDSLPIPEQAIPEGDKPTALLNYNYEYYHELFTPRQLLTYSTLFDRAMDVEDDNIAEFLLLAISNNLERGSKLTKWDDYYNISGHVFERHAYIPRVEPVEGNVLNTDQNIVAVENFFDKVVNAKKYCERPFEKLKEDGSVNQHYVPGESVKEERREALRCKTAENLLEADESVDYVITDPPYFDNIQYSELSEYFYVWLHECLKDSYEAFEPEHVPSTREIVANRKENKGEDFFIESLTNVFSECHRVLKRDGEMVFTYHHNENEAWSVILEALIESGFTVTGAYPVQSEMPNSTQIRELDNAEYDIIIFANKDETDEQTTLDQLREDLFFELQEMVDEERRRHGDLSAADLGVILRGKCLYYYSKHYPNVYADGERVSIREALDTVDSVIEQILDGTVNLPQDIDPITQAYTAFCQRGREEYDDLNKHLLAKNLNVSDLEDEKLVTGPRDRKEPVTADERINYIETKLNENGQGANALLDIDKVQYLYHLYKTDRNTTEYLKEWKSADLEELAEFMADVTDDDRYERVMDMSLSQF